jgi:hypothetical protein
VPLPVFGEMRGAANGADVIEGDPGIRNPDLATHLQRHVSAPQLVGSGKSR